VGRDVLFAQVGLEQGLAQILIHLIASEGKDTPTVHQDVPRSP
jgi:hypothetical protein